MYSYSIIDLQKVACINQSVTVIYRNGTKVQGILLGVLSDRIELRDHQTNLVVSVPNGEIDRIDFKTGNHRSTINHRVLNQFKHQRDKLADESHITLAELFRSEIQAVIPLFSHKDIIRYLESELSGKAAHFSFLEYEWFLECFEKEREKLSAQKLADAVIYTLLLLRTRSIDKAYSYVLQQFKRMDYPSLALILIGLSRQMKNQMEALFWLDAYYRAISADLITDNNTWWYYLRTSCRYATFDKLYPVLMSLKSSNPCLAVDSIAYLLISVNSGVLAESLLDIDPSFINEEIAGEVIDRNIVFLPVDSENNYRRFLRCITTIIKDNQISTFDDDDDIGGYIFDYIPDRGFGFIIGLDLVVYFFRKESIISDNVTQRIKSNICSLSSVRDEELVWVTFKRSTETKLSYCAVSIV